MLVRTSIFMLLSTIFTYRFIFIFATILTEDTIFDYDYCEMQCDNVTHTMCIGDEEKPSCESFEAFYFSRIFKNQSFLRILVDGHNGLRNRIAEKMKVANMVELTWDTKLAAMAQNHLNRCKPYVTDLCTLIPNVMPEYELMFEFYKDNKTTPLIVQNSFVAKSNWYPYKFLERMIQQWYFEKESMKPPLYKMEADTTQGRLLGENNFTHFAYPWSHRFGCAMSRFKGSYHVVCNYYPHFRTLSNIVYFTSGEPASLCPSRFPLHDDKFQNLCTSYVGDFFSTAVTVLMKTRVIFLTISCNLFNKFLT